MHFSASRKNQSEKKKEEQFKSLNMDTCGKSFKLNDAQRLGLPKVTVIYHRYRTLIGHFDQTFQPSNNS